MQGGFQTRPPKQRTELFTRLDLRIPLLFFHVEAELFHGRPIVDGEKNGIAVICILVVVPLPCRNSEDVSPMISQTLAFDDDYAFAFECEIEGGAVVPMR